MALATRPKSPTHYKKRSGQHHRHSQHYLKTYWPYLPMLMVVVIGLAINSIWSAHSVLGSQSDFSSPSLLLDTNADRTANHQPALTLSTQLNAAAQAKANDMVTNNYWAHISPTGKTPWSLITAAGYQYSTAGENLAYGFSNASETVTGWMSSAEHRANILDVNYQAVGFGVASSPNYLGHGTATVVVAEYAQPSGAILGAASTNQAVPNVTQAAQNVARIQVLSGGQAAWSALAVAALAGAAFALLIIRYGLQL